LGLFCSDKFKRGVEEYSEISRFENVLKHRFRKTLADKLQEEDITKPLDWKVDIKVTKERKDTLSHVSLLSDPSMRKVMLYSERVIEKIKHDFNTMKKIRDSNNPILQKLWNLLAVNETNSMKTYKEKLVSLSKIDSSEIKRIPTILIEGATGTGKSLMAKYIAKALTKNQTEEYFTKVPLVNINKDTIDAELFGVMPGTFTGAMINPGKLLANYGGIIFLDEIGDAPPLVQSKLLTYLDDKIIQMSGYSQTKPLKVPTVIVAATNKDLQKAIVNNEFRADLYHRFTYKIKLPDLKERKDDFRFLLSFALQKMKRIEDSSIEKISIKAIEYIERFEFKGNFRELESRCSKAIANAEINGRVVLLKEDFEGY